ncbi:hypothetical protein [Xanthomonas sp. MUS 060]|uniref:hypothetical protein n=1 Tax=Xanthomonas sp. MUS 060 TaxID=1588031 RepID=UPI0005F2F5A5|nr:hypothetical protein [Xanthomonas sp. MUS 060]
MSQETDDHSDNPYRPRKLNVRDPLHDLQLLRDIAGQAYETVTHPGQWFGQSAPAASTPHPAVDKQQAQQHQVPHLVQPPRMYMHNLHSTRSPSS